MIVVLLPHLQKQHSISYEYTSIKFLFVQSFWLLRVCFYCNLNDILLMMRMFQKEMICNELERTNVKIQITNTLRTIETKDCRVSIYNSL